MDWFTLALLAGVIFSIGSLLTRKLLKDKGDAVSFTILVESSAALALLPWAVFTYVHGFTVVDFGLIISGLGIATFIYAFNDVSHIKGRQLEEASIASIVFQTSNVWIFIGGVSLLGESFTAWKLLGIILVLLGNVLLLWKGKKLELTKGVRFILLSALLYSIASMIDKEMITLLPPQIYAFWMYVWTAAWILAGIKFDFPRVKNELVLQGPGVLIVGLTWAFGFAATVTAYTMGEISRILPVQKVSVILTVVFGILLLKEYDRLLQKIIGMILVVSGVLMLRLF